MMKQADCTHGAKTSQQLDLPSATSIQFFRSGAALIMVSVFWAFSAGDIVGLQQMGFGLGTAILLDATIVRIVLVPSGMKLLGRWNWYLPQMLNWLPDVSEESHREDLEPAALD